VRICIRYQRRDESTPRVLELSPEEYFDPLDPGEELSVRSVPRLLEDYQYTPHEADELRWTVLEITDGAKYWRVRTLFMDGVRSFMQHTEESDGSEEIILQSELTSGCWHTTRTLKMPGKSWSVVMDSLDVEQPAQLNMSRNFCESWAFDELKEFGNVR